MRIAWFSPFPPVRTGIADCSAELVGALGARGHAIDPYPADAAHDFPWTHRKRPYDLIVYQFGNSSHHDYEWAYALRYPGLVVMHDTNLHHARAAFLLRERRTDDYRAELAWTHPELPADVAELAVAGFDSRLFYDWNMVRGLVEASRLVGVHGEATRRELLKSRQDDTTWAEKIVPLRLGHGRFVSPEAAADARRRVWARYGFPEETVLFGCFGGLTPDKRIAQVLGALRATVPHVPSVRLLLAGAAAPHFDVQGAIAAHGLHDRVTVAGYLPETDLTDHLAACHVSLNLRWPTARETSGPWLRALAAGVPTIVIDLAHMTDVPSLDPRTWQAQLPATRSPLPALDSQPPATIAIDILDEDHSLRVAIRRLAQDAALRDRLGRAGRAWWEREHSPDAMVADYERAIADAAARPDPQVTLPPHMRDDHDGRLRDLLAPFGPAVTSAANLR